MSSNPQPLNIRNNNPGNLRFVGQEGATQGEGGFARFETPQAGLDAMRAQIELDTQTRGMNLTQFLNKYAPTSENKTSNYIDYVARKTGLDPTAPVPTSAIPQLQLAMIEMEGGPRSVSYFTKTAAQATPVQETRTTVQGPKQIGARVAGMFEPGSLPTSYTSALALNYLADTDPEGVTMGKVNEMLAEMMEDGGGAGKAKKNAIQQYAQAEVADPFAVMKKAQEQGKPKAVPRMPRMFADGGPVNEVGTQAVEVDGYAGGGDVADVAEQMTVGTLPTDQRPAGEVFRDIGRDVVRGAQYLPYDLIGAPVDIATMVMRPFGYDVEKPVGGSEYLIEKARQAGIAQAPTGSAAETATRIGMGFVNPVAGARQLGRGIESLREVVTAPIDRAKIRAAASRAPEDVAYDPLRERLQSQGIVSLATRPGGSFMYGDDVSKDLVELARATPGTNEEAIMQFAPKMAQYMERQFSTPNDPLFAATLEGRFKPKTFYKPNSIFRGEAKQISQITEIPLRENDTLTIEHINELLKRSKEGDEKARKIVARGVDRSIYSRGQLTEDQIIDQLKNADVFNDTAKKIEHFVEIGIGNEFGSKENVAPMMAAFIRQKGVPMDDQQKSAFRTIAGRISRKAEVEAEKNIKAQAKNPLETDYPVVVDPLQNYEMSEFERNLTPAMREEIQRGKPIYKYSGPYGKPFDVNDVFEYMAENDPAKWSKMSAPELIIAASGKDPSTVTSPTRIARMADEGLPLTPDQARVGTTSFMPVTSPSLGKGSEWREITDKVGLRIEGGIMEHCLKRDSAGYCNRLMNKESRYFTLRDADGQPYVSIEVSKPIGMEDKDVPFSVVRQIKGHRNNPAVPLYGEEITDFLNRWQKEVGGKLSVSEKADYVPSNFKPQQFGIENPEGFAKGGMVDKPLYDRAA